MNKKVSALLLLWACCCLAINAQQTAAFSTAGFYELKQSGRDVYHLNVGWRFSKEKNVNCQESRLDDSSWELVSLPHGLELLPEEASGCVNYQGEAWYRKRFTLPKEVAGKKLFVHFEGIMGKSKVWLNGKLLKEHFGGFLPIVVDVTDHVMPIGQENVLAVCADNSNDPLVPPGKAQNALDFSYFGGIYRDCFLIAHNKMHITDANYESVKAGGGLFVHYPKVMEKQATMAMKLHLRNEHPHLFNGQVEFRLIDKAGQTVAETKKKIKLTSNSAMQVETTLPVDAPHLWTPETPYLYWLEATVADHKGNVIDGYRQRTGVRNIDFRGENGLWLNGKPYGKKLIGVNRHQDFAIIGNALPNSLHWRDVKKLRDAGINIIRSAHYPQDPAFMDACDELGVFVIVATPGWQFWNKEAIFAERIYSDIRNMVRRDRNHASLFFWEPVLNETHFPESFALKAKQCVEEENPHSGGHYVAIDPGSKGSAHYPVIYSHPQIGKGDGKASAYSAGTIDPKKVYFTREFGDNVDDWNSHNSNSRVHRSWGEAPMLAQAVHYAEPTYPFTCLELLYQTGTHHLGGTLWHSFDHQRGYHPQPFYGGLMDMYRQPKTAYYMFMSQRSVAKREELPIQSGPMVYIAHEMSPFSSKDVTVYSNCEEVRLTVFEGGEPYLYKRSSVKKSMPSPIIVFQDAFDFMKLKELSRARKQKQVYMLAEGIQDGKVVATFKCTPSRRPAKLTLRADTDGLALKADGSDIVTLIAEVTDIDGTVKRLNNYSVRFSIEGEGNLLWEAGENDRPVKMQWGSAPILVQATHKAGPIRVKVEALGSGVNAIAPCTLLLESVQPEIKQLYGEVPQQRSVSTDSTVDTKMNDASMLQQENDRLKRKIAAYELKEVERQQDDFGEQR